MPAFAQKCLHLNLVSFCVFGVFAISSVIPKVHKASIDPSQITDWMGAESSLGSKKHRFSSSNGSYQTSGHLPAVGTDVLNKNLDKTQQISNSTIMQDRYINS